jgi:uncharacterized protein (TIGR02597 family)
MKYFKRTPALLLSSSLLLAAFVPSVHAQVTTTPVGYVTVTVDGTGGVGAEAFTYIGVPLHKAAHSAGALSSVAENSIVDSSGVWAVNELAGAYYIQILSGSAEGVTATIASNTATVLTTVEDLSPFLLGNESYAIRLYTTLADVFGAANESGIDGGSAAGNADNLLLQTQSGFATYYYKDSGLIGGTGWRSSSSPSVDESGAIITPGAGVIVKRTQVEDVNLVLTGSVFESDSVIPVEAGFNWLTTSIPVIVTLADLFGPTNEAGLDGGSSAGNADTILIPKSSGGFDTYYYKDSGLVGGTGWRSSVSPSVDESAKILATPGAMFILNRSGGAGFNLVESSPFNIF